MLLVKVMVFDNKLRVRNERRTWARFESAKVAELCKSVERDL